MSLTRKEKRLHEGLLTKKITVWIGDNNTQHWIYYRDGRRRKLDMDALNALVDAGLVRLENRVSVRLGKYTKAVALPRGFYKKHNGWNRKRGYTQDQ